MIRFDCKYYLGEKPCRYKRLCDGCGHYTPRGIRILIIKLGAIGDALRTTPLLHALNRKYPRSEITWVTDRSSREILENNPFIHALYIIDAPRVSILLPQRFDILLSLDKDAMAIALAMRIDAHRKFGYAMTPWGTLGYFNDGTIYSLMLGLDDDLKFFRNTKTYQQTIYEIAEIEYSPDPYVYNLDPDIREKARNFLDEKLVCANSGPRIGLNTGCGAVFATKKWPDSHFVQLAQTLQRELDARIYLLGGKREADANRAIAELCGGCILETGAHSLAFFAGILANLDLVVTGDTMALHLALAVKTPVVALFGPTCAQEIDFYGRGEAIVAQAECAPCYLSSCRRPGNSCMYDLTPEHVFRVVAKYFPEFEPVES